MLTRWLVGRVGGMKISKGKDEPASRGSEPGVSAQPHGVYGPWAQHVGMGLNYQMWCFCDFCSLLAQRLLATKNRTCSYLELNFHCHHQPPLFPWLPGVQPARWFPRPYPLDPQAQSHLCVCVMLGGVARQLWTMGSSYHFHDCCVCWLFETPGTIAHQASLSMEFSRPEYWSGLPFPSPGDLPNPGIEPRSPALQADSLPTQLSGKPTFYKVIPKSKFVLVVWHPAP